MDWLGRYFVAVGWERKVSMHAVFGVVEPSRRERTGAKPDVGFQPKEERAEFTLTLRWSSRERKGVALSGCMGLLGPFLAHCLLLSIRGTPGMS